MIILISNDYFNFSLKLDNFPPKLDYMQCKFTQNSIRSSVSSVVAVAGNGGGGRSHLSKVNQIQCKFYLLKIKCNIWGCRPRPRCSFRWLHSEVSHSCFTLFTLYANFSESCGLDKRFKTKINSLRFLLQKLERFEGFAEIPMLPLQHQPLTFKNTISREKSRTFC